MLSVSSITTLCCLSSRHTGEHLLQFCSRPMAWQWSTSIGGNDTGFHWQFRESGVCHFCRASVDSSSHPLIPLRDALRMEVTAIVTEIRWHSDSLTLLLCLLHDKQLPVPVAKYINDLLAVFCSVPMYVPAPFLSSPLLQTQA